MKARFCSTTKTPSTAQISPTSTQPTSARCMKGKPSGAVTEASRSATVSPRSLGRQLRLAAREEAPEDVQARHLARRPLGDDRAVEADKPVEVGQVLRREVVRADDDGAPLRRQAVERPIELRL